MVYELHTEDVAKLGCDNHFTVRDFSAPNSNASSGPLKIPWRSAVRPGRRWAYEVKQDGLPVPIRAASILKP